MTSRSGEAAKELRMVALKKWLERTLAHRPHRPRERVRNTVDTETHTGLEEGRKERPEGEMAATAMIHEHVERKP